ncbi:MAG: hypothetical protein CR217_13410 [Beijerinckiaceae bacterium]|nr:MAG: hypothetical protein CR217_13410 [Beijerinckiaceae bacterium]
MSEVHSCRDARSLSAFDPDFSIALSVADTCRAIRLGKSSVYDLINSGKLQTVVIGRRRLVLRRSVDALLNQAPTPYSPMRKSPASTP